MNITRKFFFLSSFALCMVFAVFFSSPMKAQASATDNVSGYAWSSNIGWISFNCTNTNSCATSNYGVKIDIAGNMTGYAWSSNIGWIKFGGLADVATYMNGLNAKLVGTNLTGFARACAGQWTTLNQTSPNNCSPNGGTFRTDGWDGLISLSGTNPNYGVTLNSTTGALTGYAWGSDVVGWIQFQATVSSLTLRANGAPGAITVVSGMPITLSAIGTGLNTSTSNGIPTAINDTVSTNWTGTGPLACPNSLTNPVAYTPSPGFVLTNTTSSSITKTYTLTCFIPNGSPVTSSVVITVTPPGPSLTLLANGIPQMNIPNYVALTVPSGTPFTLSAIGSGLKNVPGAASVVLATANPAYWNGTKTCPTSLTIPTTYNSITEISTPRNNGPSSGPGAGSTKIYILKCTTLAGATITANISVRVTEPDLSLSLMVNGVSGVGPIVASGTLVHLSSNSLGLNGVSGSTGGSNTTDTVHWNGPKACPVSTTTPITYNYTADDFTAINNGSVPITKVYYLSCRGVDGDFVDSNVYLQINPATCADSTASNYGAVGACTYATCTDSIATNFGAVGACIYTDKCPNNIPGIQISVPSGMIQDSYGNCIFPTDVCPNIPDIQPTIPTGMVVDPADGYCVTDVCLNILGIQTTVPTGMTLSNGECVLPGGSGLSLSVSPLPSTACGGSTVVTWQGSNLSTNNCTVLPASPLNPSWFGSKPSPSSVSSGILTENIAIPYNFTSNPVSYDFNLSCPTATGSTTSSPVVAPTVSISVPVCSSLPPTSSASFTTSCVRAAGQYASLDWTIGNMVASSCTLKYGTTTISIPNLDSEIGNRLIPITSNTAFTFTCTPQYALDSSTTLPIIQTATIDPACTDIIKNPKTPHFIEN